MMSAVITDFPANKSIKTDLGVGDIDLRESEPFAGNYTCMFKFLVQNNAYLAEEKDQLVRFEQLEIDA